MDRFVDDGQKIISEKPDRTFWKKCENIGRYDWKSDPNGHKCWTSDFDDDADNFISNLETGFENHFISRKIAKDGLGPEQEGEDEEEEA